MKKYDELVVVRWNLFEYNSKPKILHSDNKPSYSKIYNIYFINVHNENMIKTMKTVLLYDTDSRNGLGEKDATGTNP